MARISALPSSGRPAAAAGPGALSVALSEVFGPGPGEGAAAGFVLSRIGAGGRAGPVLWVQDRLTRREAGRPYLPGLPPRLALLLVAVARPADVLAAAEEGLRCPALAAVVAEVLGDPPALGFTATKRLALRAEGSGVPCWLVRHGGTAGLSAARDRWRVAALPSAPDPADPRAPGDPCWRVERFRSRDGRPGLWVARHDRAADRVGLVAAPADGAAAAGGGAAGERGAG